MKNFLWKRTACKTAFLFFILIFLINVPLLWSYYDYSFDSEDELDYAYESGGISYEIYHDLKDEAEFFEEEKESSDFKMKVKTVVESEDYIEKTNDVVGYLKTETNFKNFQTGFLAMHKNDVNSHYDSANKLFVYDDVEKKNSLEKYYAGYNNKNTKIIAGNFKAVFGLGLTFGKGNTEGLGGNLSLPSKRSIIYQNEVHKNYISNLFLEGCGIEQKFKSFKLSTIYSDLKNPRNNVPTKDFDGKIKNKTIEGLDREQLFVSCLEYNYLGFLKIGTIYTEFKTGLYLKLFFNHFFYNQEINRGAFINQFGFKNNDLNFAISYRDYASDYDNPLANSLSLHPNKTYFSCNDERGFRTNFNYLLKENLKFTFNSDIFEYTKKHENNEVVYYPEIVNKYQTTRLRYTKEKLGYEFGYKVYERERIDEYFDYKIDFNDRLVDFYVKYSDRMTSEYLSFMFKWKFLKDNYLSSQINFKDYRLDDKNDDKFSYVFSLSTKIHQNYKLKFFWYSLDLIDEDERYLQDKWKLELEFLV